VAKKPILTLETTTGCWEWTGSRQPEGYPQVYHNGRKRRLTRVIWEAVSGRSLQPGECVLHKCDNRSCVNPVHLFVGTVKDNAQDMCKKGRHPKQKLSPDQIRAIRADVRSLSVIAKEYGIEKAYVSGIKHLKSNQWVI
jgi:hypothetical protein